jgi:hypothetical protein
MIPAVIRRLLRNSDVFVAYLIVIGVSVVVLGGFIFLVLWLLGASPRTEPRRRVAGRAASHGIGA